MGANNATALNKIFLNQNRPFKFISRCQLPFNFSRPSRFRERASRRARVPNEVGECGDGGEGNILKEDVLLLQNTESQIQSSQPTFQGKQSESKVDSYPKLITLPG